MKEIEAILQELRPDFNKNGAELLIESVSEYDLTLRLSFTDDACMDCVVPGPMIERGIEKYLRQQAIHLEVTVIDPRAAASE